MHKPLPKLLPTFGICAAGSNAGKTTLITQLIPELAKQGLRVSVIKHAHHQFDIDHKGKDSYQIREAGAVQTLIASNKRWALMTELAQEPDLADLLAKLDKRYADLVLVEGFKQAQIPKIEVHRPSLNMPLLATQDSNIVAVASDAALELKHIPVLDLNNIAAVAAFLIDYLSLSSKSA
ncbi:MAG: molybdopterin-guanine dinucleotide biosynthesis protein B [Pseudomonadota bacterium]